MTDQQKKRTLLDHIRQLLESLDRALKPMPSAPQPVPISGKRPKVNNYRQE